MTTRTPPILYFADINASHAAMGFSGRTDLPDFHIFTLEETYPSTRPTMPPYSFGFYGMGLHEAANDARLEMNATPIAHHDTLTFQSPGHVVTWQRGCRERGSILYFHAAFIQHLLPAFTDTFAMFRPTASTFIPVAAAEKAVVREQMQRLHDTFARPHPYRVPLLQTALLALLYECQALYEQHCAHHELQPAQAMPLIAEFRQLVETHYRTHQSVKEYAALLGVTPNHLSQIVSATLGQRAYDLIMERVALEAKTLLCYSSQSVTDIATLLGFHELPHFTRFVKRHFGMAPLAYRQHMRAQSLGATSPTD